MSVGGSDWTGTALAVGCPRSTRSRPSGELSGPAETNSVNTTFLSRRLEDKLAVTVIFKLTIVQVTKVVVKYTIVTTSNQLDKRGGSDITVTRDHLDRSDIYL